MTPTPEQIEKMAEEYATQFGYSAIETKFKPLGIAFKAGVKSMCPMVLDLASKICAMQSLMDAQAAKVQELVEALQKSISLLNCNYDYHAKTLIEEALTKWRSP